jgi:hypothetical protein
MNIFAGWATGSIRTMALLSSIIVVALGQTNSAHSETYDTLYEGFKAHIAKGLEGYEYPLAQLYRYGKGGAPTDIQKAVIWLRKAAQNDHANAKFELGLLLIAGEGALIKDPFEGEKWLKAAVRQGHLEAFSALSTFYTKGDDGTSPSMRRAISLIDIIMTNPKFKAEIAKANAKEQEAFKALPKVKKFLIENLPKIDVKIAEGLVQRLYKNPKLKEKSTQGQIKLNKAYLDDIIAGGNVPGLKEEVASLEAKGSNKQPNSTNYVKLSKAHLKALAPLREAHRDAVAVIIGNRDYKGEIPKVSYAISDAHAVSQMLQNRLGYRVGNIIDLRNATLNDMAAVLGNERAPEGKLHDWVRPDQSDVFVFYSGHGVPGLKDKRPYLLPVDGDANRAEITGYPLDVLYKNLAMLPAKSVTVFIDACFSGDSPKGMIVKAASGISLEAKLPKSAKSMTVITAAQGDQLASWDEKAKHGLFTKHLLEALEGKADSKRYGDEDGKVSLAEVRNYLDQEMTYQARRRFGRTQQASVRGDEDTVLATVLDLPAKEDDGIEEMDAHYKVLKNANIRSGPGTSYDIVGKLEANQSVNVTGKVIGKNWFRLGDGTFVFGRLLGVVN